MKIVAMYLIFLHLVDPARAQSEIDIETRGIGHSEWWSKRLGRINRVSDRPIGLEREDKKSHNERWEPERSDRDSRRRPRPFASVLPAREKSFPHHIDEQSRRKKFRNHDNEVTFAGVELAAHVAEPSPILLPPFATPSPVYRVNDVSDEHSAIALESRNDSSPGKSSASSALGRIRIYEITTFNSTESGATLGASPAVNSKALDVKGEKSSWMNFPQRSYVNETTRENYGDYGRNGSRDDPRAFRNNGKKNGKSARNKSRPKNLRGARKYQDYRVNKKADVLAEKGTFGGSYAYEWSGSSERRTDRLTTNDVPDTNQDVGSVPGVPGRDYPIHQEHTHHHLRNIVDRFPCPQIPMSHVYLADRASRCQIFYVCYGSKTGVPMVCPNGTLFSELLQVCDWWYNVVC